MRTSLVMLLTVVTTLAGLISAQQFNQKESIMKAQQTKAETEMTGTDLSTKTKDAQNSQNLSFTLLVDKTPKEAFDAINNVRGWWSEEIEGRTDELGVFKYHYQDIHRCTIKITELVPGKKISWHVVDNYFNFVNDKSEWKDTDIVFEIAKKGDKTEVHFTHLGLVPAYECYNVCSDAWSTYIKGSLHDLITKGKGQPNQNEEIADKHGIKHE